MQNYMHLAFYYSSIEGKNKIYIYIYIYRYGYNLFKSQILVLPQKATK